VADFAPAPTPAELENAKARYLGKVRPRDRAAQGLAALPPDEKKTRGAEINQTKQRIEAALTARRQALADAELEAAQLKAEALDVTLPGRQRGTGGLHPVSRTRSASRPSSARWVSTWPKAPRSRPTG
jgi:phenylalanyl-tRNA synthetase alpha chain